MNKPYSTDSECMRTGGLWALVAALIVAALVLLVASVLWAFIAFGLVFGVGLGFVFSTCKNRSVGREPDVRAVDLARAEMGMAAPAVKPQPKPAPDPEPAPVTARVEHAGEVGDGEAKPELLSAARGGQPDDLKKIKGVGPKLEKELHAAGVFHFDQIAGWSAKEAAWADQHLVSFKGRVSRDNWVAQATALAKD